MGKQNALLLFHRANNMRYAGPFFKCIYSYEGLTHLTHSFEHVVPRSVLTRAGANAACGDRRNLWPCHLKINCLRSNYKYDEWGDDETWKVDSKHKVFCPPRHARGIIARTCSLMADEYGVHKAINDSVLDDELLMKWLHIEISDYERNFIEYIKTRQGG